MIGNIIEILKSPETYAIIVAFMALLTTLGKMFEAIGNAIPGEDWTDGIVGWLSKIISWIGKIMGWLGMGNGKK